MTEIKLLVVATLIMMIIGGVIPSIITSFTDEEVELTGIRLTTYNILSGGVDLTGDFDVPTDDSFYDYLAGIELITQTFAFFNALIFIYFFILVYAIVKALPFT